MTIERHRWMSDRTWLEQRRRALQDRLAELEPTQYESRHHGYMNAVRDALAVIEHALGLRVVLE